MFQFFSDFLPKFLSGFLHNFFLEFSVDFTRIPSKISPGISSKDFIVNLGDISKNPCRSSPEKISKEKCHATSREMPKKNAQNPRKLSWKDFWKNYECNPGITSTNHLRRITAKKPGNNYEDIHNSSCWNPQTMPKNPWTYQDKSWKNSERYYSGSSFGRNSERSPRWNFTRNYTRIFKKYLRTNSGRKLV